MYSSKERNSHPHSTVQSKIIQLLFCFLLSLGIQVRGSTNRYVPFLEKPENWVDQSKYYLSLDSFFATGSTAFKRGSSGSGIPELWGTYNLKDVIASLAAVKQGFNTPFTNPFLMTTGVEGLADRSIMYTINSHLRGGGIKIQGAYQFHSSWFFGFTLPFMRFESNSRFILNQGSNEITDTTDPLVKLLSPGQVNQVERVRLSVHNALGLKPHDWQKTGFGDLNFHVRWQKVWDHIMLMRTVNINLMGGFTIPTSPLFDSNHFASVPFMNNGHWGVYWGGVAEFELKSDLKVGLTTNLCFQFPVTKLRRIPVFKEPALFSALIKEVSIQPGISWYISPYLTLENIQDGLHLQGRYTYLHHTTDTWHDKGFSPHLSPLNAIATYLKPASSISQANALKNMLEKKKLSAWRSHYFTIRLCYDTAAALKQWRSRPTFFIHYDIPVAGSGSVQTHHVATGVELHF